MKAQSDFLLGLLDEMPRFLSATCGGMQSDVSLKQPSTDKDFLLSHICHLVDCETELYELRILRLLNENEPRLEGLDVSAWPITRTYHLRSLDESLTAFDEARKRVVARLAALSSQDWSRSGTRYTGAHCDVREIAYDLVEHDQDHRKRIATILREFSVA